MDDIIREQKVPSGLLIGVKFGVLTGVEIEKFSVTEIDAANDVTNPKLGVPNLSTQCSTCGASDSKSCDGHYGVIKLPVGVFHPYFISEIVHILNKICPGCKSIKDDSRKKGSLLIPRTSVSKELQCCKYCVVNSCKWYPKMKFRASSKDSMVKNALEITVEVNEKLPKRFQGKSLYEVLPTDYWDFIQKDPEQKELRSSPNMRTLSAAQVYSLLKDIDVKFIRKLVSRPNSLFLTCFPITPNSNRVVESIHGFSKGQKLIFDDRTRAYRRLLDPKTPTNEFGLHVRDCLSISKLHTEKSSNTDNKYGLKWIKEILLGKRTDYAFRMTIVGDPSIKFSEIGIPHDIAESLLIAESLNSINWEKLNDRCNLRLFERGEYCVRRKGNLVCVRHANDLELGDTVYRHLDEGDVLLINRPPSVHQHSLISLSVKILPVDSVVSLNPICCSPFRADFDGDCLHGYIPQSILSRVELGELVSLHSQLTNQQNGRNLLSLCHDSLTALYLLRENGVFLNKFQMQQLNMLCPHQLPYPAIVKAPNHLNSVWTGFQLLSMLLPKCFNFAFPSNMVYISEGEMISSSLGSTWLQDTDDNIFCSLIKNYGSEAHDIIFAAQDVLLGWISMRGLTVSLSDLYFCSSSFSRKMMMEELNCALQEAEKTCLVKQLMVDPQMEYLLRHGEEHQSAKVHEVSHTYYLKKKASLSKVSVSAVKEVFRDLLNRITAYGKKDNSLIAMVKSGSKGNMLKLAQQVLCLGLQHPSVPLPFRIPYELSSSINNKKLPGLLKHCHEMPGSAESNFPHAIVEDSFLDGLNPIECFVHSLSCRDSSFSENADVPGSLTRKLMFYMRDLYMAYDGTVRNAYGNQLVQFTYGLGNDYILGISGSDQFGAPVGPLAACSISEAAYSALDQPISILEASPLLSLKDVLESGSKKTTAQKTLSLFLSKDSKRWLYGPEYGAITIKNNLERVLFYDIVSTVMIEFSQQSCEVAHVSPWICHFHVCKERMKKRGLTVQSVINALNRSQNSFEEMYKVDLPMLQILSRACSLKGAQKESDGAICIAVSVEISDGYPVLIETVRDLVVPLLLRTVIRGFLEFKKVDILWNDLPITAKCSENYCGELSVKVYLSENCEIKRCWNLLLNECLQIRHLIDWKRSHPDDLYDIFCVYGIDVAWEYFMRRLKLAVSDIGKSVLPKHLLLVADCLSVTGEFVGLNSRGIKKQRDLASISSPFMQACFSNPGASFIKAAKSGAKDDLLGTVDAVAWGRQVPMGTGVQFDIIYSGKVNEVTKPVDVYGMLSDTLISQGKNTNVKVSSADKNKGAWGRWKPSVLHNPVARGSMISQGKNINAKVSSAEKFASNKERWDQMTPSLSHNPIGRGHTNQKCASDSVVTEISSWNDIVMLTISLREILHKHSIDDSLNEDDKSILMAALEFHPQRIDKLGPGLRDVKVGQHPKHQISKCFMLVRTDGTVEDFSYRKCVMGAARSCNLSPKTIDKLRTILLRNDC